MELIQAKVPILKFHDSIQNLEVDLNCNNAVGIRNTHLLYCYSRSKSNALYETRFSSVGRNILSSFVSFLLLYTFAVDWRVRPLVLLVKLWAQSQDINDAKNMTISSYSLVLMVIHFLQCKYGSLLFSALLIYIVALFVVYFRWHQSTSFTLLTFPLRGQVRTAHRHPLHRHTRRIGHSIIYAST